MPAQGCMQQMLARAYLQDRKVGAHAAVAAAAKAYEGEGRRLVLFSGGRKALWVKLIRPREHVRQPVAVCWGRGYDMALRSSNAIQSIF